MSKKGFLVGLVIDMTNPTPHDMVLVTNLLFSNKSAVYNRLAIIDFERKFTHYEIDRVKCIEYAHSLSLRHLEKDTLECPESSLLR